MKYWPFKAFIRIFSLIKNEEIKVSSFADDRFCMMTSNIMKPHSIIVEVVENSQTKLIALPVVWLLSPGSEE